MSTVAYLCTMSFDSTKPAEVCPHYAYMVIWKFPANATTYLAVFCHSGHTNDILFPGGLIQLSFGNKTSAVQTFLLK